MEEFHTICNLEILNRCNLWDTGCSVPEEAFSNTYCNSTVMAVLVAFGLLCAVMSIWFNNRGATNRGQFQQTHLTARNGTGHANAVPRQHGIQSVQMSYTRPYCNYLGGPRGGEGEGGTG